MLPLLRGSSPGPGGQGLSARRAGCNPEPQVDALGRGTPAARTRGLAAWLAETLDLSEQGQMRLPAEDCLASGLGVKFSFWRINCH